MNSETSFILSEQGAVERAAALTGLTPKEIEKIVGRFGKQSAQYNQLRGKLVQDPNGRIEIRDQWNSRVYWRSDIRKGRRNANA